MEAAARQLSNGWFVRHYCLRMPKLSKQDLYTRKYRKAKAKKRAAVLTEDKSVPSETKRTSEGVGHDSSFSADGKTADQEIEHALLRDETKDSETSHELTFLSLTTSPPKEGTSCLFTGNLLSPPWDETSSLNPH